MAHKGQIMTVLFCGFLAGLLVWHIALPDRARSETENRTLAQRPSLSRETLLNGSFTADMETYFADQFPLRDDWTGLKARCELLLGKREFNGVYLCGDTLIAKVEEPEAAQVEQNLAAVKKFAELTGGQVLLGLIPTAAEVWRDKLPAGAPSLDQPVLLQRAAEETGLPTVDMLGALSEHAAEPIYYRTDHHWTSLGAYYGYTALMDAMGLEAEPLDQSGKTTVSDSFYGTLFSRSGVRWVAPDQIDRYISGDGVEVTSYPEGSPVEGSLYVDRFLQEKDQYSSFLGGNQPLCVIRTEHTDAPRVLVIRDSYTDSLAPFLTQNFSEIHLFDPRMNLTSVKGYVEENQIDSVVVLYSIANFTAEGNQMFVLGW